MSRSFNSWHYIANKDSRRRKTSSGAGKLMADEAYPRHASLPMAAARYGLLSVDDKKVPVFPPSPFVFHVGPSCGFKGSGLLNCAAPVHAIGCLCCPLTVMHVIRWRGTYLKCLLIFSEVPLCHDDQ